MKITSFCLERNHDDLFQDHITQYCYPSFNKLDSRKVANPDELATLCKGQTVVLWDSLATTFALKRSGITIPEMLDLRILLAHYKYDNAICLGENIDKEKKFLCSRSPFVFKGVSKDINPFSLKKTFKKMEAELSNNYFIDRALKITKFANIVLSTARMRYKHEGHGVEKSILYYLYGSGHGRYYTPSTKIMSMSAEKKKKIVARNGYKIVSVDYVAFQAYMSNFFLHRYHPTGIFTGFYDTLSEEWGIPRQNIKKAVSAYLNFAGRKKIAECLDIHKSKTIGLMGALESFFPIKKAVNDISRTLRTKGYIRTACGRTMNFRTDHARNAWSAVIQGSEADILADNLVSIGEFLNSNEQYLENFNLICPNNDEIVFEIKADQAVEMANTVKSIMEKNGLKYFLKAKIGIGDNWFSASKGQGND